MKTINPQIQDAQQTISTQDKHREKHTKTHHNQIAKKNHNDKEKILKAAREKKTCYIQGNKDEVFQ